MFRTAVIMKWKHNVPLALHIYSMRATFPPTAKAMGDSEDKEFKTSDEQASEAGLSVALPGLLTSALPLATLAPAATLGPGQMAFRHGDI